MAQKPETTWRENVVIPFLKTLRETVFFPVQQIAILGDADFFICAHGAFVWLELKVGGNQSTPLQKYKASEVKRCGGVAIEACPENWVQVTKILHRLNNGESHD